MLKKILNKENVKQILILLFATLFICIPLASNDLDVTYDDGIQHIARLIGTEASIKEGQTAIMSDFCNGFGYSWNLFYSPVTAFLPLIFRIFGLSFINCIKLFILFVTFLSGITMYFFVKDVTKNKKIAVLAGIIYIFAPYRFTDMYIRNALAELTSFVFIPMVFQGLYGVLKNKPKRELLLIIGSSLLFLTHTIITMYTAIICFIYLLTQIKQLKVRRIRINLIYSIIIILLITSFFWMTLLQLRTSADYEVFKPGRMEREEVLIALKLKFNELFMTSKNSIMIFQIGLINVIALVLSPMVIKKLRIKYRETDFYRLYIFSLASIVILLIMTLDIFPFEKLPSTLKMIQFTFRLLEFTSFFTSFVVAVNISKLIKGFKYKHIILVLIINMVLSVIFLAHLHYSNTIDETKLIPAVPVTENTGRVHAGCASFEYLPSKAFENRNYIETRSNKTEIISGEAELQDEEKLGSKMKFNIKNVKENTSLELPYIYYSGYTVTVKLANEQYNIKTFETEKGFVGINIPEVEEAQISVEYTGTALMKISKVISAIGILILIIRTIIIGKINKKNKK